MARMVTADPISSMSALAACAATNSPQEAPVKASPLRSRTCAHWLMVERASHDSVRLIMSVSISDRTGGRIDRDQAEYAAIFLGIGGVCPPRRVAATGPISLHIDPHQKGTFGFRPL